MCKAIIGQNIIFLLTDHYHPEFCKLVASLNNISYHRGKFAYNKDENQTNV